MATSGDSGDTSDEKINMLCSACKEQNKNVKPEKYCVDCQDYYCTVCLKLHTTLPALRGHKLLDKEAGQGGKLLMVPTERCDRHNYKPADMYCQNHDEIGCGTCISVDHRVCHDVFYIPEYVVTNSKVPTEFLQRLFGVETKLKGFLKSFEDEMDALQANRLTEINTIKTVTKKFEERIKEAEQTAISDVDTKYGELHEKLSLHTESLKQQLEHIEKTKSLVSSTSQNQSQAFVNTKLNKSIVLTAEKKFIAVGEVKLGRRLKFVLNNTIEEMIGRKVCIGIVETMPRLYSFVSKGTVDVKLSSDSETCNIYGSCILPDGSVVVSDEANQNLKLFNCRSLTVTDHCKLSSSPYEVCCMDENKIAVCLMKEKKIKVFDYNSSFVPVKSIDTGFPCRGICYRDNILYVCDNSSLSICDMHGNVLKKFDNETAGQGLFSYDIHSICCSIDGQKIYACAFRNGKCVFTLDRDGNVLNVSSEELISTDGLAIAEYGKVLVCGSGYVAQLSESGEFEFNVTSDTPLAQALCFNCRTGRLYVPAYKNNFIHIFDFSSE